MNKVRTSLVFATDTADHVSGSSRDRHLRRCRQKQLTGTIPRKKSCTLCTQAKTRCDLQTPACTRCKTKGLDCRYFSQTVAYRGLSAASPSIRAHRREISLPTPAATDTGQLDDDDQANFDTSLDVAIVDWGEISSSLLDWTPMFGLPEHGATDLEAPLNIMPGVTKAVGPGLGYCPSFIGPNRPTSQSSRLVSLESFVQMRHRLATQPISMTGKSTFDKFHFMHLVIRAYPKMMVAGNAPPPFIHSSSLLPGRTSEALANCKGLVEMYRTMTPDNRQFVMKTITQEHERVLKQVLAHIKSNIPGQTDLVSVVYLVQRVRNAFHVTGCAHIRITSSF